MASHNLVPQVLAQMWTGQRRIRLGFSYNPECFADEAVENYIHMVKEVIFDGLGLSFCQLEP